MFETPTTWIGAAIVLGLIAERSFDRWQRRKEANAWREGVDRRQHNNGNPNGITKLSTRIDARINNASADLAAYQVEQRAEWAAQRTREGEIYDRIGSVDRTVARMEGEMRSCPGRSGDRLR